MSILRQKHNASSYHKLEGTFGSSKIFILLSRTAFLKNLITCIFLSTSFIVANAQQTDADFKKILHDRSVKIINTLGLTDSGKYSKVVDIVAGQYFDLNKIHDKTKESVAAIRSLQLSNEEAISRTKKEEEKKATQLSELHKGFITQLQKNLSDDQVEKIKDGMTYRVMPITYTAYSEMILNLTPVQKEKIYNWLKEARELAMDEGSSDDKHKVFGKFKGRINNYLSAEGYDMKKEEKAWLERLKEKKQKESAQMNAQ
jgi:hypothetical protein